MPDERIKEQKVYLELIHMVHHIGNIIVKLMVIFEEMSGVHVANSN